MKKLISGLSLIVLASCGGKSGSNIDPYLVKAKNYNQPTAVVISDIANKKVATTLTVKQNSEIQINLKDYKKISSEDFVKLLKEKLNYLDPRQKEGSKYTEILINSMYSGDEEGSLICTARVANELQVLISSQSENRVETVEKNIGVEILENKVSEEECLLAHDKDKKSLNIISYTDLMKEIDPQSNSEADFYKITENTYGFVATGGGMAFQGIVSFKDGELDIRDTIVIMLNNGKVTQGAGRFAGYATEGNLVEEGEEIPVFQQRVDKDNYTVSEYVKDIKISTDDYPVLEKVTEKKESEKAE